YQLFFCSSRRRHTRSKRDWSSDVCSSDLYQPVERPFDSGGAVTGGALAAVACRALRRRAAPWWEPRAVGPDVQVPDCDLVRGGGPPEAECHRRSCTNLRAIMAPAASQKEHGAEHHPTPHVQLSSPNT